MTPLPQKPSLGLAALVGAAAGASISAGWTRGRSGRVVAAGAVVGALTAGATEVGRVVTGGRDDAARTLGYAALATAIVVGAGLALTTSRPPPDNLSLEP